MKQLCVFYLSFFYSGKSKIAPGTCGSIAAIPLFYFLIYNVSYLESWILFILLTIFSYLVVIFYFKKIENEVKDPQWIVQDEVSGLILTGLILPRSFVLSIDPIFFILTCFVTFRFFDIKKFYPVNLIDQSSSPSAIMHDDLVSSFYSAFASFLIFKLFV